MIRNRDMGWLLVFASMALIVAGLAGCERTPSVIKASVSFSNARGVQPGAAVMLNGVAIGKVSAVEPTERGAVVRLELEAAKAASVQQNATASIDSSAGPIQVVLSNPPEAAAPIGDGAVLAALEPRKGLGEMFGEMVETVKSTVQQARDYFSATNQQWLTAKAEMQKSLESITAQSKSVGQQLQKDLDNLLKDLEAQSRNAGAAASANVEQIKAEYAALDARLAKQSEELKAAGKADALPKLEELRTRLKAEVDRLGTSGAP